MSLRFLGTASACALALAAALAAAQGARAGKADVLSVKAECKESKCRFLATVRHADEGWSHYANRWEVLDMDGNVLTTRVLTHPHVEQQPFTRAKDWTEIPPEITRVRVRAHDSVHGYGGEEVEVGLER
ncbi:MAG TPA: hypothetical protein VIY27_04550 [Myxococcota bacterium]